MGINPQTEKTKINLTGHLVSPSLAKLLQVARVHSVAQLATVGHSAYCCEYRHKQTQVAVNCDECLQISANIWECQKLCFGWFRRVLTPFANISQCSYWFQLIRRSWVEVGRGINRYISPYITSFCNHSLQIRSVHCSQLLSIAANRRWLRIVADGCGFEERRQFLLISIRCLPVSHSVCYGLLVSAGLLSALKLRHIWSETNHG